MNVHPDVRVVRTRTNLREALIDLLQHTTYASVNVTDIAKQAGVNRVTFYNHYSSKDELIEEILELLIEEYVALINKSNLLDLNFSFSSITHIMINMRKATNCSYRRSFQNTKKYILNIYNKAFAVS